MAFRWRTDDGPLLVVFGTSLPSSTKSALCPFLRAILMYLLMINFSLTYFYATYSYSKGVAVFGEHMRGAQFIPKSKVHRLLRKTIEINLCLFADTRRLNILYALVRCTDDSLMLEIPQNTVTIG